MIKTFLKINNNSDSQLKIMRFFVFLPKKSLTVLKKTYYNDEMIESKIK